MKISYAIWSPDGEKHEAKDMREFSRVFNDLRKKFPAPKTLKVKAYEAKTEPAKGQKT